MTNEPLDQATLEAVARVREDMERSASVSSAIFSDCRVGTSYADLRTILDALAPPKLPE